jgi:hypothetical protein
MLNRGGKIEVVDFLATQAARDRAKVHPRSGPRRRRAGRGALDRAGPSITPQALKTIASKARRRMRIEAGG